MEASGAKHVNHASALTLSHSTLVELIVVLVILAILAAILVPALLGWIDNAREKQYVLEARNVYMATQAAIDEVYARDASKIPPNDTNGTIEKTGAYADMYERIQSLSDASFDNIQVTSYGGHGDDAVDADAADGASGADITGMIISKLKPNGLEEKTLTLGANGWTVS